MQSLFAACQLIAALCCCSATPSPLGFRLHRDVPPSSYAYAAAPPVAVAAYPAPGPSEIQQTSEDDYNGTFNYSYETEDGTSVRFSGRPKMLPSGEVIQTMEGEFSYISPDGSTITTRWSADETGFHAEGAHIPGSKL